MYVLLCFIMYTTSPIRHCVLVQIATLIENHWYTDLNYNNQRLRLVAKGVTRGLECWYFVLHRQKVEYESRWDSVV